MIADYHEILGIQHGYVLSKIYVDDDSWMANKKIKDMRLDHEGTLILAIERNDQPDYFRGAPNGKVEVEYGDIITCYGRADALRCLAKRTDKDGDTLHKRQSELEESIS